MNIYRGLHFCQSYFSGINDIIEHKTRSQTIIGALKCLSYFTLIIPISVGIAYWSYRKIEQMIDHTEESLKTQKLFTDILPQKEEEETHAQPQASPATSSPDFHFIKQFIEFEVSKRVLLQMAKELPRKTDLFRKNFDSFNPGDISYLFTTCSLEEKIQIEKALASRKDVFIDIDEGILYYDTEEKIEETTPGAIAVTEPEKKEPKTIDELFFHLKMTSPAATALKTILLTFLKDSGNLVSLTYDENHNVTLVFSNKVDLLLGIDHLSHLKISKIAISLIKQIAGADVAIAVPQTISFNLSTINDVATITFDEASILAMEYIWIKKISVKESKKHSTNTLLEVDFPIVHSKEYSWKNPKHFAFSQLSKIAKPIKTRTTNLLGLISATRVKSG